MVFASLYAGTIRCQHWESIIDATKLGLSVIFDGKRYEFHTKDQAQGFVRSLAKGKELDSCCRQWKPARIFTDHSGETTLVRESQGHPCV